MSSSSRRAASASEAAAEARAAAASARAVAAEARAISRRSGQRPGWGAYKDNALKGVQISLPMMGLGDPIDVVPAIDPSIGPNRGSGPIIFHCDDNRSPLMPYTGVYSPSVNLSGGQSYAYRRNPEMTRAFLREVGHKKVRKLDRKGYCFLLCRDDRAHELVGRMTNKGHYAWVLSSTDGQQHLECTTPRVRDKGIWTDPEQFIFLDSGEVYSPWLHIQSISGSVSNAAITPLETVKTALALNLSVPRGVPPLKYQVAPDFQAFDRKFVLHADPRTSQLPRDWIDSLMGVYAPLSGRVMSGYPMWERKHRLTKELVDMIPESARKHLEGQGIRLAVSATRSSFLYLDRDFHGTGRPCFVSTPWLKNIDDISAQRKNPVLVGTHVSSGLETLLSDDAWLFTNPDGAFATWNAFYGKWVQVHVSFTPETAFREAVNLASLETDAPQAAPLEKKTATAKSSKKKKEKKPPPASTGEKRDEGKGSSARAKSKVRNDETAVGQNGDEEDDTLEQLAFGHLAQLLKFDPSKLSFSVDEGKAKEEAAWGKTKMRRMKTKRKKCRAEMPEWDAGQTLSFLFFADEAYPAWLSLSDSDSAPILESALSLDACSKWIQDNASALVILFAKNRRNENLTLLLNAGVSVKAKSVYYIYASLAKDRGSSFNNLINKSLCEKCTIEMEAKDDFHLVQHAASDRVGKGGRKDLTAALKRGSKGGRKVKKQRSSAQREETTDTDDAERQLGSANGSEKDPCPVGDSPSGKKDSADRQKIDVAEAANRIQLSLQWYVDKLKELEEVASSVDAVVPGEPSDGKAEAAPGDSNGDVKENPKPHLTSEQTIAALTNCESEDALVTVEDGLDLLQWDIMSEWTVDITERAHKWFTKHKKKDQQLCERVLRRLILLSTGRWPYCLAKPLNKSKGAKKKIRLYETKIDKAGRIIWEVAVAFSPRRSSLEHHYCEQVIRVWDVVLDHDNLSSAIDRTIERIERSHLRGEECALYASLDRANAAPASPDGIIVPRVFSMTQEVARVGSAREQVGQGKARHFHPASDSDREFTLLKFYELNAAAVKMLLDGQEDEIDLPFTPGPKEHEIIHYQSDPQRSILLMGRSGTGKTTCLVFRMWAHHTQNVDLEEGSTPRQLFLTKNDVLAREVERSFNNMGLAWRKRLASNPQPMNPTLGAKDPRDGNDGATAQARFLTSSEWLDTLDVQLPGSRFFAPLELEQRSEYRKQKDSVSKGVEELLFGENAKEKEALTCRNEMTYLEFRRLWRKVKSGTKTEMDCALVWKEIKSFVKGSVLALHIDREERSEPQNRFLSLDEYLALPRKQSRMDESQRREVYGLYLNYERLKKDGLFYDECDLVYNIAGRVAALDQRSLEQVVVGEDSLLPIDSLFVDEVQDFTQAELFILAKLCRDPNNLFLAGDTAQSIAVGVDFRFTDVRQIFYNSFGGIEPRLLQLSHNYRSHAGILRLAACVVELLYHFFASSLDRLPPDLGLFDGPKPVIMEVTQTADLILMLEGAKRETSRIEFGAHQVVIVRSEEAKASLPEEFGIDRDWVMTVQQAKGLEFDDVLLYNFFTDSPAKDTWRVVSSYTEEDIAEYYADARVVASGVQQYEWENPMLQETRDLTFDSTKHKTLETEIKMLYTAITRARVNCFIAETDSELARPMFNYFQRRAVVDVVDKNSVSSMRVFGVAEESADEWRTRGEYYLKNAEGSSTIGRLRLAAKCFDKANDAEKKRNTLALLKYTEMEEKQTSKRAKSADREELYGITAQLLEARDIGFLSKAALCLMRTGAYDEFTAKMIELYARLHYTMRLCAEKQGVELPFPPSFHERQYFSYAAKLFGKCCQKSATASLAIASFRNHVSAGLYEEAESLLSADMIPLNDGQLFVDLHKVCKSSTETERDPLGFFQQSFESSEECASLREAVKRAANIGCRKLHKRDSTSFSAALKLVPESSDRIKLLASIDQSNVGVALSKKEWAAHHLFVRDRQTGGQILDTTNMLVSELESEQRYSEAAETLANRGCLLEAADRYAQIATEGGSNSRSLVAKATRLRVKWVELMLLSKTWQSDKNQLLLHATLENSSNLSIDTRCGARLSRAVLSNQTFDLFDAISVCKESVMWQWKCLKQLIDSCSKDELLDGLPGAIVGDRLDFIHGLAKDLRCLGLALRRRPTVRSPDENRLITTAEDFFDLVPAALDPTRLETNPIVNSRLREVLHTEQLPLPTVAGGTSLASGFIRTVDRGKMHTILSQHVYRRAANVLIALHDLVRFERKRSSSKANIQEHVALLQRHLLYVETMSTHARGNPKKEPWSSLREKVNEGKQSLPKMLVDIMLQDPQLRFTNDEASDGDDAIVLKRHTLHALKSSVTQRFYRLSLQEKKHSIGHAIVYWRLAACFCGGDTNLASDELRNEIDRIERHPSTVNDFRKRNCHYFVSNQRREIYPRLWLWAVESASQDLMNSISVVERMIRTSYRERLVTMSKIDQISLLEVNAVALFAALSLRYSEVNSPAMLMPKQLYVERLLARDKEDYEAYFQREGFGIPLKDALLAYCHNYFDAVFEKCVLHLEHAAAMIVDNELLSADDSKDPGRFERALQLSVFICCNSVLFSSIGKDMDYIEYSNGVLELPSLPLQGSIKQLVEKLESTCMAHLKKKPGSFYDLAVTILSASAGDSLVSCRLQQRTMDSVDIHCSESLDEASEILASTQFDSTAAIFEDDKKSASFLHIAEMVDPSNEDGDHGRQSEERAAGRVIVRFVESKRYPDSKANVEDSIAYHRRWRSILKAFVGRLQEISAKRATLEQENGSAAQGLVFDNVLNPFQDPYTFHQQKAQVFNHFNNAVVDHIECTYCSCAFDPVSQQDRFARWDFEGKRVPWLQFVPNYNQSRFGGAYTNSEQLHYHTNTAFHADNAMRYQKSLEDFATALSRIRMSANLLNQIICLCEEEGSAWYLITAERGRELTRDLDRAQTDLVNAGIIWSRQPQHAYLSQILPHTYTLPQLAESFFLQKREEEAQKREEEARRLEEEKNEVKADGKDDGPPAASTLNADALNFVPLHFTA